MTPQTLAPARTVVLKTVVRSMYSVVVSVTVTVETVGAAGETNAVVVEAASTGLLEGALASRQSAETEPRRPRDRRLEVVENFIST